MRIRTSIKSGVTYHTVAAGENLSSIAAQYYGPGASWEDVMKIYYANQSVIGNNPNILSVGVRLLIPDLQSGSTLGCSPS
jgi:nucleoid-associated protein YgaU